MSLLTNILAYWKLDESSGDASDSVGSHTLTNANVTYSTGIVNNGAVFGSTTDDLYTAADTDFNFDGSGAFSFSTWSNQTTLANDGYLIAHLKSSGNYEGYTLQVNNSGKLIFYIGAENAGSNIVYVQTGNGVITTGAWYHVVVTYDGSKTAAGVKIYVNGVKQGLSTVYNNFTGSSSYDGTFQIGSREGNDVNFAGTIDEVGCWTRALTSDDVDLLYNAGRANQYSFTTGLTNSLVSYWKFNESSGNASDSIGSNTLTNNNSIPYTAGKIANCADLEYASSQYFTAADSVSLSFKNDVTFAGWFNFESFPATSQLFAKRTSTDNQRSYNFFYDDAEDKLKFNIFTNGSDDNIASVSYTAPTSTWVHIAVAYNAAAGSAAFYVNGTQQGTTQTGLPTAIFDSTSPFSIGTIFVLGTEFLDGKVDECGAWSRTLSATDIATLYNNGNGNSYPFYITVHGLPPFNY